MGKTPPTGTRHTQFTTYLLMQSIQISLQSTGREHPLAPPGTKAIIYEAPENRPSWGPRGIDAWYLGPAKDHYRNYKFFVPETKGYHISESAKFYPQHCTIPEETPDKHATNIVDELIVALKKLDKTKYKI